MRINLISNFSSKGLGQDSAILRGLITNQFPEAEIRKVQHYLPECSEAELNIFVESVNPALFISASRNIWIPNPEWTYKTWIPYIPMFDEIWVKTHEAFDLFKKYTDSVRYIGWTSIDKIYPDLEKDYSKAVVLVGKNIYRNPKPVLKAYYDILKEDKDLFSELPELHIPYKKDEVQFFMPPELEKKVKLYDVLSESEYDDLLHTSGLAICISSCEGFGHGVNEAMSAGCNLILSNIKPFHDLAPTGALWTSEFKIVEHPRCLGSILDTSSSSVRAALEQYIGSSLQNKKKRSETLRKHYEERHRKFIETFKISQVSEFNLEKLFIPESELPCVSIVTLTYNRQEFFPLAKYSYLIQSYPEDKLEWVIVDDGESIEELLLGIPNVTYVRLDKKTGIAEKRNIGVQAAMYDTLVFMDDDDVYPNNSVLARVSMLLQKPEKDCVFCTTIPCYDIEKKVSFMNVPPITLEMSERVSEATLCFKKSFWQERKFQDDIAEGDKFIRGREQMCREISPQEVIVSLVHKKNISSRKSLGETNGCHYGFCDELFLLVDGISCPTTQDCLSDVQDSQV